MRTEHPEVYHRQQELLLDKAKPVVLSMLEDCMTQTLVARVLVSNGNKEKDLKDQARLLAGIKETYTTCHEKWMEIGDLRKSNLNVYNALKEPFDAVVYCLHNFRYILDEKPSLEKIYRDLYRLYRKYYSMFKKYDHEWKSIDFGPDYNHDVGASFDSCSIGLNPYLITTHK